MYVYRSLRLLEIPLSGNHAHSLMYASSAQARSFFEGNKGQPEKTHRYKYSNSMKMKKWRVVGGSWRVQVWPWSESLSEIQVTEAADQVQDLPCRWRCTTNTNAASQLTNAHNNTKQECYVNLDSSWIEDPTFSCSCPFSPRWFHSQACLGHLSCPWRRSLHTWFPWFWRPMTLPRRLRPLQHSIPLLCQVFAIPSP